MQERMMVLPERKPLNARAPPKAFHPVMIDFAAIQQSVQVTNKHVTTEQNTQQREGRIRLFDAIKAS